jgi:(p)ppGpp synthase/HD superfamily hydrolase
MILTPAEELALGIKLASEVHYAQYDKGGKPYILHPLFLMNQLLFDLQLAAIAIMHDVIEDSNMTIDELFDMGFSVRVLKVLELLTHNPTDTYQTYIEKMKDNYDVIRVKRKDIDHNSRTTRLKGFTIKDTDRMAKYHNAFMILGEYKKKFTK